MKRNKQLLALGVSCLFAIASVSTGHLYAKVRTSKVKESDVTVVTRGKTETSEKQVDKREKETSESEEKSIESKMTKEEDVLYAQEKIDNILQADGTFNPDVTSDEIYYLEKEVKKLKASADKKALEVKIQKIMEHFGL